MSAPHLDDRVLASLQEVTEDEYPVLLDTFVLDSEERLRSLHAALQAGDAQALRHTAHSFKGGSSNMGAVLPPAAARSWKKAPGAATCNGRRR